MSERPLSSRNMAMRDFLARSGWGAATVSPLPGDASTRHYARLSLDDRKAMLMDQPQGAEGSAAPADASEEARRALGYNAVARLAGADCARFVAAAEYLRAHGLARPKSTPPITGRALSCWKIWATRCLPMSWPKAATRRSSMKRRSRCWRAPCQRCARIAVIRQAAVRLRRNRAARRNRSDDRMVPAAGAGPRSDRGGNCRASRACGARRSPASPAAAGSSCIATITRRICSGCRTAKAWRASGLIDFQDAVAGSARL